MLKADRASSPRFADDDLEGGKVREVPAQIVAARGSEALALPRRSVVWGARLSRVLVAVSRRDELSVLEMP